MKRVKIIGVPEHFNLPWHLAIDEEGLLKKEVLIYNGKMCQREQVE